MSTDLANLEFTADEMRRMGYATIERLVDHILSLETQRICGGPGSATTLVYPTGDRRTRDEGEPHPCLMKLPPLPASARNHQSP